MNGAMISRWSHVTRQRGSLPLPDRDPAGNPTADGLALPGENEPPLSTKPVSLTEGALRAHPHANG